MQDAALYYRHTALGCFHRRRKYPLLSPEWRHEVENARRFIRACRAKWDDRPREIIRTAYALGPQVRTQQPAILTGLDSPYLRCVACGWVHCAATEADEAFHVLDRCYKCKGLAFEIVTPDAVPRGVTLLPLRWPRR